MSSVKTTHIVQVPATCSLEHTAVTLENGVRIVVTVDPKTNTSSTAGSVFVGSHWDPAETPGLAHLCEHMLFLGTKRDPEEGGFDKFLSKNAGHSNAWTEDGVTNYHFQCSNAAFNEAMVRFSHFFVEPTMTPSALEREVQAVHSEDEKNHPVDYWCQKEMMKEKLVDKRHPHSRYGNGNAATLWDGPKQRGVDLHAVLMKFYDQHYVAENLVVAVYSPLPAKQVIETLEPILKKVRSGTRNVHSFSSPPSTTHKQQTVIAKESLGTWTNMKTNSQAQRIVINIPIATSVECTHKYNALHYLSWVLGHECNGTIVDVLRREDLCTSLSTGTSEIDDDNSIFAFDITVTAKGLKNVDRVIDLVFEGVDFFKQSNLADDEQLFAEMIAGDHLAFNMREPRGPSSHTSSIARNCNIYGPERAWSTVELLDVDAMNAGLIKEKLEFFRPDNAFYVLHLPDPNQVIGNSCDEKTNEIGQEGHGDSDVDDDGDSKLQLPIRAIKACATLTNEQTTHHKAHFSVAPIEASLLQQWGRKRTAFHPAFKRPSQNPFISKEFAVLTKEGEDGRTWASSFVPKVAHESKWGRVLWRPDAGTFDSPKGCCIISLETPVAYASGKARFFVRTLAVVLQYALAELTYFGQLGAMSVEIETTTYGLYFLASGPREKLLVFVNAVIDGVFDEIYGLNKTANSSGGSTIENEEKYKACADSVLRSIQSLKVRAPYLQGSEWVYQYSAERRIHWTELLADINNAIPPFEEFIKFVREALFNDKVRYDALVAGNVVLSDAISFGKDIVEKLIETKLPKTVVPAAEEEFKPFNTSFAPPSRKELASTSSCTSTSSASSSTSIASSSPEVFGSCFTNKSSNEKDVNSSASVLFFHGESSPDIMALSDVTWSLLKAHYFEGLRTRETIGYIVYAQNVNTDHLRWTNFCAQSAKLPAWYILSRTIAFLKAAETQLFGNALDDKRRRIAQKPAHDDDDDAASNTAAEEETDYLESQVREAASSIASECRDKPKNLGALATRIWSLRHHPFGFDVLEKEAAILDDASKISAKTVREFFNRSFLNPEFARPVISLVHGTAASLSQGGFDKFVSCDSGANQMQNKCNNNDNNNNNNNNNNNSDKNSINFLSSVKAPLPPREGEVPAVKDDDVSTLELESYRFDDEAKRPEVEVLVVTGSCDEYRNWRRTK